MNRGETTIRDTEVRVIEYSEGFYREDVIKDINQFSALTDKSKVTWIKVCGLLDREEITKLAEKFNIHPLTLEDILNTDQRPKIEEFYNYTYIVLRIFQFDPLEKELLSEQMSIIVGENFLISVEEKTNTAIQKIIDWIKSSRGIIRRMGIDYLLYLIIDEVIDGYFLVLEEIEDRLEELEDELTTNPTSSTLQAIHRFKRQLLQFNKNTWPLREVIGTLGRTGHRFIDNQTIPYFRDLYDHTVRVIENTETLQVMLSDMLDVYFSAVSNRLNEVMKILTMIATVFMPLTFIAGIYGMNFKYMPELEWVWGYPAVLLIMAGIGLWMILYFRRKKWI
ncbi:MAG: magnesium/cobalt transporter CorA [Thaumarchaeota archaeon]|nr:magnesium/cobalt transporter CorA [Candidatus Geocrenenecus arthurdayi]